MKVLVTGGSGLVGKNLKELCPNFIYLSSSDCNLLNYDESLEYISNINPTHIIHLAAKVGGLYMNLEYNFEMLRDNLLINTNIINICRQLKIKNFIGCLSTCIFPANVEYPITEEQLHNGDPHTSNEGYAYGKRMLEVFCRQMNKKNGYNYICIIPTNIYGKYDNYNLEHSHVIPGLIHKCYLAKQENKPFVIMGTGKPLRQFLYVKDLAKIINHLLAYDGPCKNIICAPPEEEEISISELASHIARIMKYENIRYDNSFSDGQFKKTVSNKQLMKLKPDFVFTSMEDGLKETIEWFMNEYNDIRK